MILYRLAKRAFADDLSGIGAKLYGGRWNSKGHALLYTSENRSLCTTEIAVHTPLGIIPVDYYLISIEIPDHVKLLELNAASLPKDWKSHPPSFSTQLLGDAFIKENAYLVLKVPSVVVQGEYNFLINPLHKDIRKVKIKKKESFSFDERLF